MTHTDCISRTALREAVEGLRRKNRVGTHRTSALVNKVFKETALKTEAHNTALDAVLALLLETKDCPCGGPRKEYKSHYCCWEQKQPPACGQELATHKQCCLCERAAPTKEKPN